MGKDKKKQLKQLLDFVRDLYEHPDNTEFADGIRELVLNDKEVIKKLNSASVPDETDLSSSAAQQDNSSTLDRIAQYLSLDYKLDEQVLPDYSFVDNEDARDKLYSDFREMMRYRYGTRNHKVDFPEFCRFAALQLEMLINYYYDNQYPSVDDVVIVIQESNHNYNPSTQPRFISEIPLKTKLYHLPKESKIGALNTTNFTGIIDIRNRQSHRSLSLNKDLIKEVEEKLKAGNAWDEKFGGPAITKESPEDSLTIAQKVVGKETLAEYQVQKFLDKQPYDDIIKSLQILAAKIRKSLIE